MHSRLPHLPAFWENAVTRQPRATACVWQDRAWSFAEVEALVGPLAGYLRDECGVRPGDRVALALPNCPAFLFAYWATLRLGAVVVPLNIRLAEEELAFVLADAAPRALFLHEDLRPRMESALQRTAPQPAVLGISSTGDLPDGLLSASPAPPVPDDLPPEALAIILYTSGTTGMPKGAMMRHADLLFNVQKAILAHSFRHEDVHLLAIPCFAPTATYSLLPSCAYLASPVVIAPRPQPAELLDLVDRHRCTTFLGVPTLFSLLLHDPALSRTDLSSLRLIAYSGSPMPAATIRGLRARFPGVSLHNFFGLTETISITHVLPSPDAVTRADSIGKLLPEVYARVVDEAGRELPPGDIGELCFRRDNVIPGYWNQPGRLEESLRDGWFHTGDLAWQDEEGYFYVQGRKKEMIIVAGQNVYAHEVEKVILRHTGVREVAVVGIPATGARAALGELVKAVVVPQPAAPLTELALKRHCAEHLPSYKVPQVVEFRDELPRNAAGKVLKRLLA